MKKLVATTLRSIAIEPLGVDPLIWSPATPVYTETEAEHAACHGSPVLVDKISWSVANCILTGYLHQGGSGEISATATQVKCDSKKVMREGDTALCSGEFQLNVSPFTIVPCSCRYTIDDAGQSQFGAM